MKVDNVSLFEKDGNLSEFHVWVTVFLSVIATGLGASVLYVDDLIHYIGIPRRFSLLKSNAFLSANLSFSAGVMIYTSLGVLIFEAIESFSKVKEIEIINLHPTLTTAVFVVLGGYINDLLSTVLTYFLPTDKTSEVDLCLCSTQPGEVSGMDDMGNSGQNGPLGVQISSNSDILKKNCESRHEERCLIDYNDETCLYKSTDTAKASSETVNILSNCKKEKPGKYQNYTRYGQEALGERDIKIMNVCPVLETHKKSRVCDEEAKIISHSDQSEIEIAINSPLDTENTGLGDWGCNGDLAIVSNSGRNADISQMEGTLLPSVAVVSSSTNTPQVEVSDLGKKTGKNSTLLFVGLKTSIAVALHKFPEGVILYLSSTSSHRIGLWVASSLFVHNFPEGLMLALPLFLSTKSKSRTLAIALVMGAVPPVLGALFGAWMARATDATGVDGITHSENRGLVQNMMFGLTFAVASGMMLAVSITGMLPAAKMYDPTNKFVTTISFLVSVLFSHFVGNVIFAD